MEIDLISSKGKVRNQSLVRKLYVEVKVTMFFIYIFPSLLRFIGNELIGRVGEHFLNRTR